MSEYNNMEFDEIRAIKEMEHEFRIVEIQEKGEQDRKTEEVKKQNALEQERLRAEYEKQQQKDRIRGEGLLRFGSFILYITGLGAMSALDIPDKIADKAHNFRKG